MRPRRVSRRLIPGGRARRECPGRAAWSTRSVARLDCLGADRGGRDAKCARALTRGCAHRGSLVYSVVRPGFYPARMMMQGDYVRRASAEFVGAFALTFVGAGMIAYAHD